MGWNEDRLHRWIQGLAAPACLASRVGHDAAVLPAAEGRPVQCADQCIEGVHFESGTAGKLAGRKVVQRALSDLAATGASPVSVLLTIAAGAGVEERWLRAAITGARLAAAESGAGLVGGDLAQHSGGLVLAAFAHGTLAGRRRPPGRDRARVGQMVVLTGPVGGSRLGRHLRIRPAIKEGLELYAAGATAMMDVSDGLAWDLHRMARSSGVRIELQEVPVHRDAKRASRQSGRSVLDHALHDGEDHVLIACIDRKRIPKGMLPIGRVMSGKGVWLHPGLGLDRTAEAGRGRLWQPGEGGWSHGSQS